MRYATKHHGRADDSTQAGKAFLIAVQAANGISAVDLAFYETLNNPETSAQVGVPAN